MMTTAVAPVLLHAIEIKISLEHLGAGPAERSEAGWAIWARSFAPVAKERAQFAPAGLRGTTYRRCVTNE